MKNHRHLARRAIVLLSLLSLLGCAVPRHVPIQGAATPAPPLDRVVQPPDPVALTLVDGRKVTLVVTSVTTDTVTGTVKDEAQPTTFERANIANVERLQPRSKAPVGGLVLGGLALLFLVILPGLGGL